MHIPTLPCVKWLLSLLFIISVFKAAGVFIIFAMIAGAAWHSLAVSESVSVPARRRGELEGVTNWSHQSTVA
jgi:hypothetical protein